MKSFLVGLGVGVGLGVLLAPDRAENTRLHGITAACSAKGARSGSAGSGRPGQRIRLDSDDLTCETATEEAAAEGNSPGAYVEHRRLRCCETRRLRTD